MDLGECHKAHDLALRADYEAAAKETEHGYELDVSKILLFDKFRIRAAEMPQSSVSYSRLSIALL